MSPDYPLKCNFWFKVLLEWIQFKVWYGHSVCTNQYTKYPNAKHAVKIGRDIDENNIVQRLDETFGIFRQLRAEWSRIACVYDVMGNMVATSVITRGADSGHCKKWKMINRNMSELVSLQFAIDYKNLPRICSGTGKSTRVKDLQSTTRLRRVVEVAHLWHEGGFPCPCTKSWLIIFLLPLSIPMTKPHFCFQNLLQNVFWLENGANLGYNHDITSLYDLCRNKVFAQAKLSLPR